MPTPRSPLEGLKVVDLTTFLSGPSATQLLGDLGAEIIKVEPLGGDSSRDIAGPKVGGESAYFLANNRNKRSIAMNLKTPEGLSLLRQLIATADVVVENYRPGVCERLGFAPAEMLQQHPKLIWASISGFGQEGPQRNRPAYDMVVQALSGVMSLTGHPGQPAARLGIPAGDVVAGLYAVIGILASINERTATNEGQHIDVSMLNGQLAMLSYQAVYTDINGSSPGPQGAGHDSIATYRSFVGGDGREFAVTANTERMWQGMCSVIGRDELVLDPRFLDAASRLRNRLALWEILESEFAKQPASYWVDALVEGQVPVAPVKSVGEALSDAREADDGSLVTVQGPDGTFTNVATPIRFSNQKATAPAYPPRLGEHTAEILTRELGYSDAEAQRLARDGIVVAFEAKFSSV